MSSSMPSDNRLRCWFESEGLSAGTREDTVVTCNENKFLFVRFFPVNMGTGHNYSLLDLVGVL